MRERKARVYQREMGHTGAGGGGECWERIEACPVVTPSGLGLAGSGQGW